MGVSQNRAPIGPWICCEVLSRDSEGAILRNCHIALFPPKTLNPKPRHSHRGGVGPPQVLDKTFNLELWTRFHGLGFRVLDGLGGVSSKYPARKAYLSGQI